MCDVVEAAGARRENDDLSFVAVTTIVYFTFMSLIIYCLKPE